MIKLLIILLFPVLAIAQKPLVNGFKHGAAPSAGFMLDSVATGPMAAYSLRRVNTSYTGSLIRVRESGGDTEANIGYDGSGILDTTALKTFVGANNGLIVIWYDQSGNGNNLTTPGGVPVQAAEQPKIVSSGIIEREGGKVSILWANNGMVNSAITVTPANGYTFLTVARSTSAGNGTLIGNGAGATTGTRWALGQAGSSPEGNGWAGSGGAVGLGADASYNTFSVKSWIKSSSQWQVRRNNSLLGTFSDASTASISTFYLCVGDELYQGNGYYISGRISEVIMYNAQLNSTDRQLIERNQGSFYGITVL